MSVTVTTLQTSPLRVIPLRVALAPSSAGGDHGALSGLGDDDHPQYLTSARGDARYAGVGHVHTSLPPLTANPLFERPASASLNNVNFRMIVNQTPFTDGSGVGGENYANEVTAIGWNLSQTVGNPATVGTPAIWDNWEFKYNIGGFYNHERHMEFVDTSGVRHRYFSAALRHNGSYDQAGFFLDNFFLHNKAGVAKYAFDLVNNAISVGDAATGLSTYYQKNALPPHKQRNAANNGWLNLPFFDANDKLNVEGQVLQNGAAPGTGAAGWSMNWSGTPGNGSVFFASQCGADAGNATLTGLQFDAKTNWDLLGRIRNLKTGTQYSSAVWDAQTSSSNGMAYMRFGYDAGQQWSIGMRDTQNFVLSASQNLLSSQVFSVDKTNLNVAFDKAPKLPSFTVAGVPSATTYGAGSVIYVSNESGGGCVAFSDGTNWRRVTDRAVVS